MEPWEGCHRRQSLGKTGNPLRNSRWPLSCCDLEGGLPEGPSIYVFHSLNNDVLIFFWCLVHVSYHACLNVMYLTISQIGGHRIMWFRITYTPATDDTKIRDQNITFEKFCPSTPPHGQICVINVCTGILKISLVRQRASHNHGLWPWSCNDVWIWCHVIKKKILPVASPPHGQIIKNL